MNMHSIIDGELFLDILTKEEKESLLTKKMEEIRKKNDALRKRHEEIEADKRNASKSAKVSSPVKESKPLPGEERRPPKSTGRNKNYSRSNTEPARTQKSYRSRGKLRMDCKDHESDSDEEENFEKFKNRPPPQQRFKLQLNTDARPTSTGDPKSPETESQKDGPPPDPVYNFLSDRSRQGNASDKDGEKWRHPKNYGGRDFQNVKHQMKATKEEQDRFRGSAPRSKMEMEVTMTGRERRQYAEWKAERQRVDNQRIERQKLSTGEWTREWDADKMEKDNKKEFSTQQPQQHKEFTQKPQQHYKEFTSPQQQHKEFTQQPQQHYKEFTSPQQQHKEFSPHQQSKTEPAKRPAGRIGSGRFDRGERDERPRGGTLGLKAAAGVQPEESDLPSPTGRPSTRGRVIGRGRGRGRPRQPHQRQSSGEEQRIVECQKDLIIVKIDNSPGSHDGTIEVEYADPVEPLKPNERNNITQNVAEGNLKIAKAASSPTKVRKVEANASPKHTPRSHKGNEVSMHPSGQALLLGREINYSAEMKQEDKMHKNQVHSEGEGDHGSQGHSSHSQSFSQGDTDEWEDCPDDGSFYSEGSQQDKSPKASQSSTSPSQQQTPKKEKHLNPAAVPFTPTSPDFLTTPPGHVKVFNWAAEMETMGYPISPTSPQAPGPYMRPPRSPGTQAAMRQTSGVEQTPTQSDDHPQSVVKDEVIEGHDTVVITDSERDVDGLVEAKVGNVVENYLPPDEPELEEHDEFQESFEIVPKVESNLTEADDTAEPETGADAKDLPEINVASECDNTAIECDNIHISEEQNISESVDTNQSDTVDNIKSSDMLDAVTSADINETNNAIIKDIHFEMDTPSELAMSASEIEEINTEKESDKELKNETVKSNQDLNDRQDSKIETEICDSISESKEMLENQNGGTSQSLPSESEVLENQNGGTSQSLSSESEVPSPVAQMTGEGDEHAKNGSSKITEEPPVIDARSEEDWDRLQNSMLETGSPVSESGADTAGVSETEPTV